MQGLARDGHGDSRDAREKPMRHVSECCRCWCRGLSYTGRSGLHYEPASIRPHAMTPLIPIILSGGAGARLWPLSREAAPKPFMQLPDGETLLAKTASRAYALPGVAALL